MVRAGSLTLSQLPHLGVTEQGVARVSTKKQRKGRESAARTLKIMRSLSTHARVDVSKTPPKSVFYISTSEVPRIGK